MSTGLLTFETRVGWIGILTGQGTVKKTVIGHPTEQDVWDCFDSPDPLPVEGGSGLVDLLQRFTAGQAVSLNGIPIDESWMSPFQKRVVRACREIPWGKTLSYGQLAEVAGSPGASRAVGSVMSRNRFPLIVPCHRVLGSRGLGGFSAPNGPGLKRRLLVQEGVLDERVVHDNSSPAGGQKAAGGRGQDAAGGQDDSERAQMTFQYQ